MRSACASKQQRKLPSKEHEWTTAVAVRRFGIEFDSLNLRLSEATGFVPPVINAKIKEEKKKAATVEAQC